MRATEPQNLEAHMRKSKELVLQALRPSRGQVFDAFNMSVKPNSVLKPSALEPVNTDFSDP